MGILRLGLLAAAFLLAACAAGADLPPLPDSPGGDYTLSPGDQVMLMTDEPRLARQFTVGASGNIDFPLIGVVRAQGLTSTELGATVAALLQSRGILKDPSVAIEVTAYRPIFILGEVNHAGQFPYRPGETVLNAVAVAGGFTDRAAKRHMSIVRSIDGRTIEGRASADTLVQPGDTITVLKQYF